MEAGWALHKEIYARMLRWTVTDCALSADSGFLAYSSITPVVHLVRVAGGVRSSVGNVSEVHEALQLTQGEAGMGVWSVKLSADSARLLAGASDHGFYLYDLASRRLSACVGPAHGDDVNSVCFADAACNLVASAGDDAQLRLWDVRCMALHAGGAQRPAGVLLGHTEGLTHVAARGDGRHLVSNGKDQVAKVWDLRAMVSAEAAAARVAAARLPN